MVQNDFKKVPASINVWAQKYVNKWTFKFFPAVLLFPPVRLMLLNNFPTSTTIPDPRVLTLTPQKTSSTSCHPHGLYNSNKLHVSKEVLYIF